MMKMEVYVCMIVGCYYKEETYTKMICCNLFSMWLSSLITRLMGLVG
jgi:hypothetical protein